MANRRQDRAGERGAMSSGPYYAEKTSELREGRDGLSIKGAWWYTTSGRREVFVRLERNGQYVGTVVVKVPAPARRRSRWRRCRFS